jgi:hypothetical protein
MAFVNAHRVRRQSKPHNTYFIVPYSSNLDYYSADGMQLNIDVAPPVLCVHPEKHIRKQQLL